MPRGTTKKVMGRPEMGKGRTTGGISRARPTGSISRARPGTAPSYVSGAGAGRRPAPGMAGKGTIVKARRVNLPSGRPAKGRTAAAGARGRAMTRERVIRARNTTAAAGSRRSGAPSQAGQLKYGQVRSGGQGIGAALESYGDIGDFLKNLGH